VEKIHAYGIVQLLKHGETVLLQPVDAGRIPLRIAIVIFTGTNEEVQGALIEGHETGDLRGAKLEMARRIIAMRLGKDRISGRTSLTKRTLSAGLLIEEYEQHVQHQPSAVARLSAVTHRLMIYPPR
jgi:ParB family chromosome partitioning protein